MRHSTPRMFLLACVTACAVSASAAGFSGATLAEVGVPTASTTAVVQPAASPNATPGTQLQALALSPENGVMGTSVSYSASGLTPGLPLLLQWQTWDGSYDMTTSPETVQYNRRQFADREIYLGPVAVADDGTVAGEFTVPEDFGEIHNVTLVSDGVQVARGGFQERVQATVSPPGGPIGTPIDIHVTGLAAKQFSGLTLAVRWDNVHTGLINATLNHGTADAVIRAVGPVGEHEIVLNAGGAPAYLNIAQSPYAFFYQDLPDQEDMKLPFDVTADNGPPPDTLDWPDSSRVAHLAPDAPRTAMSDVTDADALVAFDVDEGPIQSQPTIAASGLDAGQPLQLTWVTARGNRVTPSGWSLQPLPLAEATASDQGTLTMPVTIPDDLGGWHTLQVVQNGQVVAQAPYLVDRSLVSVSPDVVHAGDTVTVHLKGFGWTELDNGAAVTYDCDDPGARLRPA